MLKALLFFLILDSNLSNSNDKGNRLDEMMSESRQRSKQIVCLADSVASFSADVDTASFGYKLFKEAEKYLGVPYVWGGRSKKGLDCMGVIFLSYSDATGKSWRGKDGLSVYPSKLVKSGKLGSPVEGLDGIIIDSINIQNLTKKMEVGDIVYLLTPSRIIEDDSLATIDSTSYWPWHMVLYAGHGNILHANPLASRESGAKVTIDPLIELLKQTGTTAIFVTRIKK